MRQLRRAENLVIARGPDRRVSVDLCVATAREGLVSVVSREFKYMENTDTFCVRSMRHAEENAVYAWSHQPLMIPRAQGADSSPPLSMLFAQTKLARFRMGTFSEPSTASDQTPQQCSLRPRTANTYAPGESCFDRENHLEEWGLHHGVSTDKPSPCLCLPSLQAKSTQDEVLMKYTNEYNRVQGE